LPRFNETRAAAPSFLYSSTANIRPRRAVPRTLSAGGASVILAWVSAGPNRPGQRGPDPDRARRARGRGRHSDPRTPPT